MSYIDKNLIPGEEIVYRAKSGGTFGQIITFAIIFALVYYIPSEPEVLSTIKLALYGIFGFSAIYWVIIRDMSDEFVVTSKRIVDKRGFIGAKTDEINLDKVERVIVEQSITGRLFGEGTIKIKGAGVKEGDGIDQAYIIKKPNVFKQKVYEAIEALK